MINNDKEIVASIQRIIDSETDAIDPDLGNVIELLSYINLKLLEGPALTRTTYWEFLNEVLKNIHTGKWTMHPNTFINYVSKDLYNDPLPYKEVNRLRDDYLNNLRNLRIDLGFNPETKLGMRNLLLYWVRNKNGFQDILTTCQAIIRINYFYYNKEIEKN